MKNLFAALALISISATASAAEVKTSPIFPPTHMTPPVVKAPASLPPVATEKTISVPVSLVKDTLDFLGKQPLSLSLPMFQEWARYLNSKH